MNPIGKYTNGNYSVAIFSDGTKIRMNDLDNMVAAFPESIDMKITNACKGPEGLGPCPFCHEQSVPNGKHANLSHPVLDSLHPFTELALGGGNVLEHPDLLSFLYRMRKQRVICNMTLHIDHFIKNYDYVRMLQKDRLIHGLGVSINTIPTTEQLEYLESTPNLVVHTIAGVMPREGYEALYGHGIKLLILGYKYYGRGENYFFNEMSDILDGIVALRTNLPDMMPHFKLISFDNLALKQLCVQEIIDKDTWKRCYMGDDGEATCYIDLVSETFSVSSVSERIPLFSNNINELFQSIKKKE